MLGIAVTKVSGFQYCTRRAEDCFWLHQARRYFPDLLLPRDRGGGGRGTLLSASLEMILRFPPLLMYARGSIFKLRALGRQRATYCGSGLIFWAENPPSVTDHF